MIEKGMVKINIEFSKNATMLQDGIFTLLNDKKEELVRQGRKIFNLSVGTPDMRPEQHIMETMAAAAMIPDNYKYALSDKKVLLLAVSDYYRRRFSVNLELDEITSLSGSQEGMTHIWMALCNPGDIVLVPNPGYPIFHVGPTLNGLNLMYYELREENGFLPDFNEIPEWVAHKAKAIVVSYPSNPTCTVGTPVLYRKLIQFAKKYNIVVIHDNAYPDIIFDGRKGTSFLAFPGAKEVGIEFYSLSKTFNLTGARISFAMGNKEIIKQFKSLRSQIDYGIFLPIQEAAIAALTGPQGMVIKQKNEYEARRNALCDGLRKIGWYVPNSQGTMFVWAPIPEGYNNSTQFCMDLLEKTGVICVPGSSFGSLGENYVRFALVIDIATIEEMIKVIKDSNIIHDSYMRLY